MNLLSVTSAEGKNAYGYTAASATTTIFTAPVGKTIRIDNFNFQQNASTVNGAFGAMIQIYDSSASTVVWNTGIVYISDLYNSSTGGYIGRNVFNVYRGPFYLEENDEVRLYSNWTSAGLFYCSFGYLELS